jgi:hypothetical protein
MQNKNKKDKKKENKTKGPLGSITDSLYYFNSTEPRRHNNKKG